MADLPQQNRPAQQAGSGYTNLSQYIGANQNNQLGNVVAGGVQQAGQAATGAVNQAGAAFQQGVNTEQTRLGQSGAQATASLGNLGNIQDSDVSNFQSALSGKGQGPTGLANANDLTAKSQSAQQQGAATGSELGRFGLLQNYVGRGQQYGLGQQTLDSAILGQTGQKQLGQARAATSGLGAQANRAISSANAQGQQLQNQAQQLAASTQGQLGTAVTGYDTSMQDKLAADQANTQATLAQFKGTGTNAAMNIDAATLKQLSDASGGVLGAGTQLYNTDISPFLSANTLNNTKQDVQSTADFAKAQALGKLAGATGLQGTDQQALLQSYLGAPQSVGTYDATNPFLVSSQSGLADLLKNAGDSYNKSVAAQQANINNIQNLGSGGEIRATTTGGAQAKIDAANALLAQYNKPGYQQTAADSNQGTMTLAQDKAYQQNLIDQYNAQIAQNTAGTNLANQNIANYGNQFQVLRTLNANPAVAAASGNTNANVPVLSA